MAAAAVPIEARPNKDRIVAVMGGGCQIKLKVMMQRITHQHEKPAPWRVTNNLSCNFKHERGRPPLRCHVRPWALTATPTTLHTIDYPCLRLAPRLTVRAEPPTTCPRGFAHR